jgi:UDP-glucose 4-epimerase
MKHILITGGAGYIGSHTITLLQPKYKITVIDDLSNSSQSVLDAIEHITTVRPSFHLVDIKDANAIDKVFQHNKFDAVIHFAGCKFVDESLIDSHKYYTNNVMGTINLLTAMKKYNVKTLVFSSSAAVYGNIDVPVQETSIKQPSSPYGRTKSIIEDMLLDLYESDKTWTIACLRYFNPVGAHSSGLIGDSRPTNLMSIICRAANKDIPLVQVFGDDYDTIDGSAVRDFIHVMDLAQGHISVLEHLNSPSYVIANVGTGIGVSVLQLIHTFQKTNNIIIPHIICDRRPGDIANSYASTNLITSITDWAPTYSIEQMCIDAWNWYSSVNRSPLL